MLKQYIFIPIKPKMSKGKIASQSCHASYMGLFNQMKEKNKEGIATTPNIQRQSFSPPTPANK